MKSRIAENIEFAPGTIKTVRRFAYLPKKVKEWKIWLEWYEELWVYRIENIPALTETKNIVKSHWDKVDERIL